MWRWWFISVVNYVKNRKCAENFEDEINVPKQWTYSLWRCSNHSLCFFCLSSFFM